MPSRDWDTRAAAPLWVHSSCRDADHLERWAEAAGLPPSDLKLMARADAHASLSTHGASPILFLQIPSVATDDFSEVQRDWLLAVFGRTRVITVSSGDDDLAPSKQIAHEETARVRVESAQADIPFQTRVIARLLLHVIERNRVVADRFEREVMRLETLEGNAKFLRDTFGLRRTISAAELDLWHVKEIVRGLADGKVHFGDLNLQDEKILDDLGLRVESTEKILATTKEELQALLQLHIDIKSFEMNKFLKLLAVIGFLGLIPSVIAGLLGMNVHIEPFNQSTIGQVSFIVGMSMATGLYIFAIKGWLR
jgi:Mg2+ and Co2+ transporter CorA